MLFRTVLVFLEQMIKKEERKNPTTLFRPVGFAAGKN